MRGAGRGGGGTTGTDPRNNEGLVGNRTGGKGIGGGGMDGGGMVGGGANGGAPAGASAPAPPDGIVGRTAGTFGAWAAPGPVAVCRASPAGMAAPHPRQNRYFPSFDRPQRGQVTMGQRSSIPQGCYPCWRSASSGMRYPADASPHFLTGLLRTASPVSCGARDIM